MSADRYYLRLGSDDLDQARPYRTRADAVAAYSYAARELAQYGQDLDASVHLAPSRAELAEYPDLVLSLGPRGGLRVGRA
jgi:hypothetical protein